MHSLYNTIFPDDDRTIIERQYEPLKKQLSCLFANYRIDLSCRMNFEQQVSQLFEKCFLKPIPTTLTKRILREHYLINSIQYELRKNNLILRRTADNLNTFYLGSLDEFETICTQFMNETHLYVTIKTITESETEQVHLKHILELIDAQLRVLCETKVLPIDQLDQFLLQPQQNHLRLPRLYFLPDNQSDAELVVQPRFTSYRHSPIQRLAKYLDRKLRQLFESICRSTLVKNRTDFFSRFNSFRIHNHPINKDTWIGTLEILDLYENIGHEHLLDALNTMLSNPLIIDRCQKVTPLLLLELTALVLKNNFFVYRHQIYRFQHGCPLNLPLTKLLCNIYLHVWQTPLWRAIRLKNVFYARFNDQAMVTWNDSREDLQKIFDELANTLPEHVHLKNEVNTYGRFMGCLFDNDRGRIHTTVARDPNQQPFVLPYYPGHPRLIYRQWYRFMIMRAVEVSIDVEDFQDERRYIETTLLANGYSLDFVEYLWRQFIRRCGMSPTQILLMNSTMLTQMRTTVSHLMNISLMESSLRGEEYILSQENKLINLYYLYDWGLRPEFTIRFRELWETILNSDAIFKKHGLQFRLKSKHRYSSNALLSYPRIHTLSIQ